MRIPQRKGEQDKRALQKDEPIYLTKDGIKKLQNQIERIQFELPGQISELQRTREMGDLSENAAYQHAKHQVRRMQGKLFHLVERLKNVIEIEPGGTDSIQLGSTFIVEVDGNQKTYEMVGPLETNPMKGRISHQSPLGEALTDHKTGDEVSFHSPVGEKIYKIISIS